MRYNHYRTRFETLDGLLPARLIEDAYCFSFAFQGAYRLRLNTYVAPAPRATDATPEWKSHADGEGEPVPEVVREGATFFEGVQDAVVYRVWVEEDPAVVAARGPSKPLVLAPPPPPPGARLVRPPPAAGLLTAELKALSADELRAGGDRYRALLEARDLEDTLFSRV